MNREQDLMSEEPLFHFNMVQLTALLKRQAEQNPSASYFNVDILKVFRLLVFSVLRNVKARVFVVSSEGQLWSGIGAIAHGGLLEV